ncbi:hypothetical protein ACQ4PT_040910 [Festuca glaucescens]
MMAAKEGSKVMTEGGSSQGGQTCGGGGGDSGNATPKPGSRGANSADGLMKENTSATPRPFGLLMAPPVGGGDHGGLVERPAHPKPPGGVLAAPMPRRSALLDADRLLEGDVNWDDGNVQEEMGFRQGAEAQIGGIVDMEDDVYLEFDEEEVVKEEPSETKTWSLLASLGSYIRCTLGEQDDVWGKRYGKGLGEALDVDVPASEQEKKEFLRVRVKLPYDRRLQTQLTTGVKGKPREVKVFKLKYERVPYYCSHCGFMGHKKDECEKKRLGVPSLDYDAHELRCNPYKKFEHQSHFVPPAGQASAKRGLSFASFGSAESYKHFDQRQSREPRRSSVTPEQVQSRADSVDNEIPPLIDDPLPDTAPECADIHDSQVGKVAPSIKEVESALAAKVDAMVMDPSQNVQMQANLKGNDASLPIIQFPDEEVLGTEHAPNVHVQMTTDMLAHMQRMQARQGAGSGCSNWERGPRASDMIPALQGMSNLQVSFGSVNDVSMMPADTILGKRAAEEQEVQGERLELSLGLDYGGMKGWRSAEERKDTRCGSGTS